MLIATDVAAAAAAAPVPMTAEALAGATPIMGPVIEAAMAAAAQPAVQPPPALAQPRPAAGPPPGAQLQAAADRPRELAQLDPAANPPPDLNQFEPAAEPPPDVAWLEPAAEPAYPPEPAGAVPAVLGLISSDAPTGQAAAGAEPRVLDGVAANLFGASPPAGQPADQPRVLDAVVETIFGASQPPDQPAAEQPVAQPRVLDAVAETIFGASQPPDQPAADQPVAQPAVLDAVAETIFGTSPRGELVGEPPPLPFKSVGESQASQTGMLAMMGGQAGAATPPLMQQAPEPPPGSFGLMEIADSLAESLFGPAATELPQPDHPLVRALQNGDPEAYALLPDSALERLQISRGQAPRTTLPNAQALVYELENPGAIPPAVLRAGDSAAGGIPREPELSLADARAAPDDVKRANAERIRDKNATISRNNALAAAEWQRDGLLRGDPAAIDALSREARCAAEFIWCVVTPTGPLTPEQVDIAMRGVERVEDGSGLAPEEEARAVRDNGVEPERPDNAYEAKVFRQAQQRHEATKPDKQPGYRGRPTPDLTLRDLRAMVNPTEPDKPIASQTSEYAVQRAIWGDEQGSSPPPAISPHPEIAAEMIPPAPRAAPVGQGETVRTKARALAGPGATSWQVREAAARLVAVNEVRFGNDGQGVDIDAPLDTAFPLMLPPDEAEYGAHRQALLDDAGRDAINQLRERDRIANEPMPADPPRDSEQLYYKRVAAGSDQAVPATLEQYRWAVAHHGKAKADEMFIPVSLKRVLPDDRHTRDKNVLADLREFFIGPSLEYRDATVDEYLAAESARGPDAVKEEFYRGAAPSPPAPTGAGYGFLDGTRKVLAFINQSWKMTASPARDPHAPAWFGNIQAGIGGLPDDLVDGIDATVVQLRTLDDDLGRLVGDEPVPGSLEHLDGTPVDDAPKRPGETDAEAFSRTDPVLGGYAQAAEHQRELVGAAAEGDLGPLAEAWTQRPWDTAFEVLGLVAPLGATGALGRTAGHAKGGGDAAPSSIARPLSPGSIEGGGRIPAGMWPTLVPRKPAAAAAAAAAGIGVPQRPAGHTPADLADGFQARYPGVADDGTTAPKIDDASLPQLTGVFQRAGSGGREVASVRGAFVPTQVTGAGGELRTLHWLGGRGDVVKIELVPEVNDARRPDILVTVRMPDNTLRVTRVEVRSLTGARPGYQPRGVDRTRDSTARQIARAIKDKVKSTDERHSQLNEPIDGVPVGGTLALHVRGGPKAVANVQRVMARLQHKMPDYVEEVAIFVGGKTTPLRFVNPNFVPR